MDRKRFTLIIVLQLLFLLAMVGTKVYTLKTGEKVLLKVVPVDPRTLFRGEYARLTYNISSIDLPELSKFRRKQIVYVTLRKKGKFWEATAVSGEKPEPGVGEIFIVGRKEGANRVRYGIEAYFLPEGEAIKVERLRRSAELSVEVAIDTFGNAVISRLFIDGRPVDEFLEDKE